MSVIYPEAVLNIIIATMGCGTLVCEAPTGDRDRYTISVASPPGLKDLVTYSNTIHPLFPWGPAISFFYI
jgi:hypothetical protein